MKRKLATVLITIGLMGIVALLINYGNLSYSQLIVNSGQTIIALWRQ